jgi:hypothetical protein
VFNRIVQLNLNAKRMKFIFKKYIDFEKAYGTEATHERALLMARKYVENKEEALKMALQLTHMSSSNGHQNGNNDENMDFDDNDDGNDENKNQERRKNTENSNNLEKNLAKNLKI